MSIVVEHEKRRHEILGKALDVFVEEGFEDVTFQKIADRCGITRTTLYVYFKNKRDIFNYSIKQFLSGLESNITGISKEKKLNYSEKLIRIMVTIIESLEENQRLLSVILNYIMHASKGDYDPSYRVRRRTVRLRHMLTSILIGGRKAGEFTPSVVIKDANELLYGILETAVFRLIVMRRSSVDELKAAAKLVIHNFSYSH